MLEINGITTPMLRISIKLVRMVNDIAKIIDIDGFDTKSAELFANNLDSFVKLLNNLN